MKNIINEILRESLSVKETCIRKNASKLIRMAEIIALAFTNDRKLMICGNGGSAADAQHLATEFVNRFILERPPLPAIALTTDSSILTSIGNDYSFKDVFSKQVKALGMEGDILLGISTSGKSENVVRAVKSAKDMKIYSIGFLGNDGGSLADLVDIEFTVNNKITPRIQETHILAGHIICHLVDYILFQKHTSST